MQDSLTAQPVAQGWAILEFGTRLSLTPVENFSPGQKIASDAQGSFSLCAPSVAAPSVIVLTALDASGNAYPPFVASVSGTTDLGRVFMGGCALKCGLYPGQQQTSTPATIQGAITTSPIAKTGSVTAQYAMMALDGSKDIWSVAIPALGPEQSNQFTTAAGVCDGGAPDCAAYTFTLPSQTPLYPVKGGYQKAPGSLGYDIYAAPDGTPACTPPSAETFRQKDGKSFLIGTPGSQLSAADIAFTGCR